MNKDSVTDAAIPLHSSIKSWLQVQLSDRTEALPNKTKKAKEILPFATTYNQATPNLKKIIIKHWHIIQQQPRLAHIFNQPSIVYILQEGKIAEGRFSSRKSFIRSRRNRKNL